MIGFEDFEEKVAEGRALAAEGAARLEENRRARKERAIRKRQQREAAARMGGGDFPPLMLLTAGQVEAVYGLSRHILDALHRDGKLHRIDTVGKHPRWRAGDVADFIRAQ